MSFEHLVSQIKKNNYQYFVEHPKKEKLNQKFMHPTFILIVRNLGHTNF